MLFRGNAPRGNRQPVQRTLTDEEVDHTQREIVERLQRELGATLRS